MPRHATREVTISLSDSSRGIMSGLSERGIAMPNWRAGADNLYGRPIRAKRVRPGSRDISSATLAVEPHSLMGFYSGGGNKLFVGAGDDVYEAQSAAYPFQTMPASHILSTDIWSHTNLNGLLIMTQRGGANTPLIYDGSWKSLDLPTPGSAPTVAAAATGNVDAGPHYYRYRWMFDNGSSLVSPVSLVVTTAANQKVNLTGILTSSRDDYIGFVVERTKVNGTALGPFWFVTEVIGSGTTAYADSASDASLGYLPDDGLHGQPPHFDGLTGFAGLLWGWDGSSLYASRDIGDLEATGIANFDAEDLFQISKDDGDEIQVCVVVLDELLILKKRSVHVISGVDRDSFVLTSVVYADPARGSEAGCAGPRAACVIGGKAYFWGESGGMFVYSKGTVAPFGWVEMGRYLDDANESAFDNLLLINHQGNYLQAFYPRGSSSIANEQIVYDARLKHFWHWKGWAARDAIELKGGLFAGATQVIADPEPDSNGEYHLWATFDGFKDKRDSGGANGTLIRVAEETPWLDFGYPDDFKDLDRIAIAADGDQPTVTVSIVTDPPGGAASVTLSAQSGAGKDWAEASGSNPNDLEWDVGDWASDSPTSSSSGVQAGTFGRRLKLILSSTPDRDYVPTGIEMRATLLPDKEYS